MKKKKKKRKKDNSKKQKQNKKQNETQQQILLYSLFFELLLWLFFFFQFTLKTIIKFQPSNESFSKSYFFIFLKESLWTERISIHRNNFFFSFQIQSYFFWPDRFLESRFKMRKEPYLVVTYPLIYVDSIQISSFLS